MTGNTLYYGDNLDILREYINDESIDLVYIDPPFNSGRAYNVIFSESNGSSSQAQVKAFEDTWHWTHQTEKTYSEILDTAPPNVVECVRSFRNFLGEVNLMAYLVMMTPRLIELHRVLKPTGSFYLHCDPTASHYLKVITDAIWGAKCFKNEIIWRRTGSNKAKQGFGPIHQTILFYVKTKEAHFYPQYTPYTKEYIEKNFKQEDERGKYQAPSLTGPGLRSGDSGLPWRGYNPGSVGRHWQPPSYLYDKYRELTGQELSQYPLIQRLDRLDEVNLIHQQKAENVPRYRYYVSDAPGVPTQDIWAYQPGTKGCVYGRPDEGIDHDIKWLSTQDKERLGYPTQKPEGILERIIMASTKEGDTVLDAFCGCGTTVVVAERLGRRWIGIDVTHLAITLIKNRLNDTFGDSVDYNVIRDPKDLSGAHELALEDRYEFECWALGLIQARPINQKKKGADRGIDGVKYINPTGASGKRNEIKMVVQVKSGHNIGVRDIRDFKTVVRNAKAQMGAFLTLSNPTGPMVKEALVDGYYSPGSAVATKHPKIQILTIEELLSGKKLDAPYHNDMTYRRAERAEIQEDAEQPQLL